MSSLKNTRMVKPGGGGGSSIGGITGTAAFNPATSSSSSGSAPLADPTTRRLKEELDRISQDIHLMNCKIADMKGEAPPSSATIPMTSSLLQDSATSPFVTGLRNMTDSERRIREAKEVRLQSIEALLERVAEYDRLVLAKTAPTDTAPKRRKSIGADLITLPTHLQVIDRLVDIHGQSKRVAVIRTTVNGESPRVETSASERLLPPANNNANEQQINNLTSQVDSLKQHIEKLHEKLSEHETNKKQQDQEIKRLNGVLNESEKKNKQSQEKIQSLQDEIQRLNQQWQKQIQDATEAALQAAAAAKAAKAATNDDDEEKKRLREEIERLKISLKNLSNDYKQIEERLSIETSINKSILNGLLRKASNIMQDSDDSDNDNDRWKKGGTTIQLDAPEEFKNAFNSLDNAIDIRIDGFRREVKLLLKVKETLEGEISSINLQRDMLQQDLTTLSDAHGAMTAAYHSLSYETATASKSNGETDKLKATVEEQKRTINKLETDLLENRMQLRQFEQWPALVGELEGKLRVLTDEKNRYESLAKLSQDEMNHYKKLTDSLKAKIKSIGDGHNSDTRDYLDTFEEVMKEEMMVMKTAFETKLKNAKDEADAMSKRHQQEINRMQNASPFPLLGKIGSTK